MSSTKNPFLTFRNIETDKMVAINIHNITTYHEKIDDEGQPYVLKTKQINENDALEYHQLAFSLMMQLSNKTESIISVS